MPPAWRISAATGLRPLLVDVGHYHVGALTGEEQGRRPPLPTSRPRDDGHFTFQAHPQSAPSLCLFMREGFLQAGVPIPLG